MEDRIPTKPNRYAVYDDNHNFLRYEYHERADEPTQTGDALNKANLLPDDVVEIMQMPEENPQVGDALAKLALGVGKFGFSVTVKFSDGSPAVGINIAGLKKIDGSDAITDTYGKVLGVSPTATVSLSVSGYLDLQTHSSTIIATGSITQVNINLVDKTTKTASITTSQSIMFSRVVYVDAHLVGGGYDGGNGSAGGYTSVGGDGGENGKNYYVTNIRVNKATSNNCVIGAKNGGNTTFLNKSSASGSNSAGGQGGRIASGNMRWATDGSGGGVSPISSSFSYGGSGGGGGPSGGSEGGPAYGKGSNGGGDGGTVSNAGTSASRYGGGGGGGGGGDFNGNYGVKGLGRSGVLYIGWRYA